MCNSQHLNRFYVYILNFNSYITFLIRNVEMFNIWLSSLIRVKDFLLLAVLARGARGTRGALQHY
jgi:hypothetical protein